MEHITRDHDILGILRVPLQENPPSVDVGPNPAEARQVLAVPPEVIDVATPLAAATNSPTSCYVRILVNQ
jgi:hypothetical protein